MHSWWGSSCPDDLTHGNYRAGQDNVAAVMVLTREGKGNHRVVPILWPWPYPGCLRGVLERQQQVVPRLLLWWQLLKAILLLLPSTKSVSVSQYLCSTLVTAGQAVCQCCFRLSHPCTQPSPWSSTFYQCCGPWCFRKAFVHKDNKSCSYLPECSHNLNLLFWKGVRINSSSAQTQCSCPWWFSLSSLIINASSPCQHF